MSEEKVITSYKGFNKDMTCRGFQYEEGKDYETDRAEACKTGFHACEYPLDCFGYYAPASSEFHVVELAKKRLNGVQMTLPIVGI